MAIKIQGTTVIDDSRVGTLDSLTLDGTGALKLPVGTTAERPTASLGQLRYNSDLNKVENYTSEGWKDFSADEFARTLALSAI